MHRDQHFIEYARKVAEADAGRKSDGSEGRGLPETPNLDALRQANAPQHASDRFGSEGWLGDKSWYLDPERHNRDYGGYRPAFGEYADPARRGDWKRA